MDVKPLVSSIELLREDALSVAKQEDWVRSEKINLEIVNLFATHAIEHNAENQVYLCDALNELGMAVVRQDRPDESFDCFLKAIEHFPEDWRAYFNIAQILLATGKEEQATEVLEQAMLVVANKPESVLLLARIYEKNDKLFKSIPYLRSCIYHHHNNTEVHAMLLNALAALTKTAEGLFSYEKDFAQANELYVKANQFKKQGEIDAAIAEYKHVIQLCPERGEAFFQLAECYASQQDIEQAIQTIEVACALLPHIVDPLCRLALWLAEEGRYTEAIERLMRAKAIDSKSADVHLYLGFIHAKMDQDSIQALEYLEQSIALGGVKNENFALAGDLNIKSCRADDAVRIFNLSYDTTQNLIHKLQAITALPFVYASEEEFEMRSHAYRTGLRDIDLGSIRLQSLGNLKIPPPFLITYQGMNDVAEQKKLAQIYMQLYPDLNWIAPHCLKPRQQKKIKIGFISAHFKNHTISHLNKQLIEYIDRNEFEVILFRGKQDASSSLQLDAIADKTIVLDSVYYTARQQIAAEVLDVLYYTDIGIESLTYMLAFARLAHVQVQSWGHPETSGLPHMDYFLSSEALDLESAQAHYSEKLIRFKNINCCYERPGYVGGIDRAQFGFREDERIYACPQNLYKFQPQFDAVLADILKRDPQGRVVLLKGKYTAWEEVFYQRFAASHPLEAKRLTFIKRLKRRDFIRLQAAADVVLEPRVFGNGNSSYETFSVGAPVVCWPTDYLRCRITYAQLKQMRVDECIVDSHESYVERAVQFAQDKDFRQSISEQILERNELLFDDRSSVRELETFLKRVIHET